MPATSRTTVAYMPASLPTTKAPRETGFEITV